MIEQIFNFIFRRKRLSKDICLRCFDEAYREIQNPVWGNNDEGRWQNGLVLCPFKVFGKYSKAEAPRQSIYAAAPMMCPYRLEHLMETKRC